ncbi:MAG: AI-2E family transporter [Rubrobacter sp.]
MEHSRTRGLGAYLGVGLLVAVLFGVYYVYPVRVIALVSLLTLLFAVVLSAPVDYLARRGLGRAWGLLVVAVGLFLALLLTQAAADPLLSQAQGLSEDFPALLAEAQALVEGLPFGLGNSLAPLLDPDRLIGLLQGSGLSAATVLGWGSSAVNLLSLGVVVLLTGAFAVLYPAPLVGGFVALFPAAGRQRVRQILGEMYATVQRWFVGQLADMAIMGVLSAAVLWIIGVPFALLLGVLSGVLGFVPYVGFAISLVPPVLLALADDPLKAVWVVVAYVLIQQVEINLIYPFLMSRAVSLHPAVVVFALFVLGLIFGITGLVIAIPLAAASQVLVRRLWVERMDRSGVDPNPPAEIGRAPKRGPGLLRRPGRRQTPVRVRGRPASWRVLRRRRAPPSKCRAGSHFDPRSSIYSERLLRRQADQRPPLGRQPAPQADASDEEDAARG